MALVYHELMNDDNNLPIHISNLDFSDEKQRIIK